MRKYLVIMHGSITTDAGHSLQSIDACSWADDLPNVKTSFITESDFLLNIFMIRDKLILELILLL
jgi:hypothetical protein